MMVLCRVNKLTMREMRERLNQARYLCWDTERERESCPA